MLTDGYKKWREKRERKRANFVTVWETPGDSMGQASEAGIFLVVGGHIERHLKADRGEPKAVDT